MNRLSVPAVSPDDAIDAGTSGTLVTPADPSRQRFNIGVRTLAGGATIAIALHDSSGILLASRTRSFDANFFQQFSFAELLGRPPGANQSIAFEVVSGSAIVYGSSVDNTTGAMSLQLARPSAAASTGGDGRDDHE